MLAEKERKKQFFVIIIIIKLGHRGKFVLSLMPYAFNEQ